MIAVASLPWSYELIGNAARTARRLLLVDVGAISAGLGFLLIAGCAEMAMAKNAAGPPHHIHACAVIANRGDLQRQAADRTIAVLSPARSTSTPW